MLHHSLLIPNFLAACSAQLYSNKIHGALVKLRADPRKANIRLFQAQRKIIIIMKLMLMIITTTTKIIVMPLPEVMYTLKFDQGLYLIQTVLFPGLSQHFILIRKLLRKRL